MKRLSIFVSAFLLAVGTYAANAASSARAAYSEAPLPSAACRIGTSGHYFTLPQARACAPEAPMIAAGQSVSKPGRYLVRTLGGYFVAGFGSRVLSSSGQLVDAQADQCSYYSGGTFREIYSYEYFPDGYIDQDSGNCVISGSAVYNLWNSPGCNEPGAQCDFSKGVICNWCYQENPWMNVQLNYWWGGSASDGCRQYLDAGWGESWWCF